MSRRKKRNKNKNGFGGLLIVIIIFVIIGLINSISFNIDTSSFFNKTEDLTEDSTPTEDTKPIVKDEAIDEVEDNIENNITTPTLITLDSNYAGNNVRLNSDAADAYIKMFNDMTDLNLAITIKSGYRSYDNQAYLYESDKETYLEPSMCEHLNGNAIDIITPLNDDFTSTDEYQWLIDNSYKYGYIFRYPENKRIITNHVEDNHFTFIGVNDATYLNDNNLVLEEK
jgi:D-alanyl-D-alanine carboxypeptidase